MPRGAAPEIELGKNGDLLTCAEKTTLYNEFTQHNMGETIATATLEKCKYKGVSSTRKQGYRFATFKSIEGYYDMSKFDVLVRALCTAEAMWWRGGSARHRDDMHKHSSSPTVNKVRYLFHEQDGKDSQIKKARMVVEAARDWLNKYTPEKAENPRAAPARASGGAVKKAAALVAPQAKLRRKAVAQQDKPNSAQTLSNAMVVHIESNKRLHDATHGMLAKYRLLLEKHELLEKKCSTLTTENMQLKRAIAHGRIHLSSDDEEEEEEEGDASVPEEEEEGVASGKQHDAGDKSDASGQEDDDSSGQEDDDSSGKEHDDASGSGTNKKRKAAPFGGSVLVPGLRRHRQRPRSP